MLKFVRAGKADQDRIGTFLGQFTDDYLTETYPRYLGQYVGGLYMATDGEDLVGVCVISLPKPKEALLSGMRIAPARQGLGLGEEFGRFQLEEARRLGAEVVRVLVHKDNVQSAHVLQDKLGFEVVDEWAVGEINPLPVPDRASTEAGMAWAVDQERLLSFVRRFEKDLWSPDGWDPRSVTASDINFRFERGGIAVSPQRGEVQAMAFTWLQSRDVLHISYLRVLGQALQGVLDHLWNEARAWGINRCRFGVSASVAERMRALVPNCEITWRGMVLERRLNLLPSEA